MAEIIIQDTPSRLSFYYYNYYASIATVVNNIGNKRTNGCKIATRDELRRQTPHIQATVLRAHRYMDETNKVVVAIEIQPTGVLRIIISTT